MLPSMTRATFGLVGLAMLGAVGAASSVAAQETDEVRARHILVVSERRALEIIGQLNGGADFAELAQRYSLGPSAPNGGDLGYFGRGTMAAPFEEAAFALAVGEVSAPVQTRFGWHVIMVEDRRSADGTPVQQVVAGDERVRVRHILVESRAEAETLIGFINDGKDFGALAELFSIDDGNAGAGGDLGFIRRGETVPAFEEAAFALAVGEVSAPVETSFGWHIILLEAREGGAAAAPDPAVLFDPAILAEHLNDIDLATFGDLPPGFGAAQAPSFSEVVDVDSGVAHQKVSFALDEGDLERGVEFRVYETPAAAAEARVDALVTPEIRRAERYSESEMSFSPSEGVEFDASCAHRPLEDGATVTEVHCTLHPPGSQVLITAFSYGAGVFDEIDDLMLLSGRPGLMFDLVDAIAPAYGELQRIEAALREAGGVALRPPGGWVLDPNALTAWLSGATIDAVFDIPSLIGAPGGATVDTAVNSEDRERGLTGKVVIPMDGAAAEAGIEFWVFGSPAEARHEDALHNALFTPESVAADGSALVDTWRFSRNVLDFERSWNYVGVTCGARPAKDGAVPRQLRCAYMPPDRQVGIVGYVYGADPVGEITEAAAFDLIQGGLGTLLDGEAVLLAGRSPADNGVAAADDGAVAEVPPVDPGLVGSWELYVPVGSGLARLQFDIGADGNYRFWSDHPAVDGHSGSLNAEGGQWSLTSPTWEDGGSYELPDAGTAIITGKLGPAAWSRLSAAQTRR